MPSTPGKGQHPQRPQDARLLHLVQVVGAPMVNVVAQACGHHGKGLQVCVVALQLARLQRQAPRFLLPTSLPALPGPLGAQLSQQPLPSSRARTASPLEGPAFRLPAPGAAVGGRRLLPAPIRQGALSPPLPRPRTMSSVNMVWATLKPWRQLW